VWIGRRCKQVEAGQVLAAGVRLKRPCGACHLRGRLSHLGREFDPGIETVQLYVLVFRNTPALTSRANSSSVWSNPARSNIPLARL